jgi:GNAT superfamily N-acetyltransferase
VPESQIAIRRATAADLPTLARFGAGLARQHHGYDPRRYHLFEPLEETYARFFAEQLGRADAALLIGEVGGRTAGYAFVRLEPESFEGLLPPSGWVHDLYVDAPERGAGVGTRLLDAALQELRRLGAERALLGVAPQNAGAARLFERRGFRPTLREMTLELPAAAAPGPALPLPSPSRSR